MKRFVAHSEKERKDLKVLGLKEVGQEENGNYVFWSNKIEDVLSEREKQVYDLKEKTNEEIADILEISSKSVESYKDKIKSKGF